MEGIEKLTDYLALLVESGKSKEALTLSLDKNKVSIRRLLNQEEILSFDITEDIDLPTFIITTSNKLKEKIPVQDIFSTIKSNKSSGFHLDTALRMTFDVGELNGLVVSFSSTNEEDRKWFADYFQFREGERNINTANQEDYKKRIEKFDMLTKHMNDIDGVYRKFKPQNEEHQRLL